jgi:hypothetical protein
MAPSITAWPISIVTAMSKAKANIGISATDNEGDIVKFVTDTIEKNQTERRNPLSCKLQAEIKKALLEKSNGM